MSRVSASKAGLLSHCSYWARPDVPHVDVEPGDYARDGTALHALCDAFVKSVLSEDVQAAILKGAADRDRVLRLWIHARAWLEAHASPWMRTEVPTAWDPERDQGYDLTDALKAFGLTGPRPYANPKAWQRLCAHVGMSERSIPGTVDVVDIQDGTIVVFDWCTGSTAKREQLACNALTLARLHDVDAVRTVTLRLTEDGVSEETVDLDAFDLNTFAGEMASRIGDIPTSEPQPGSHCASMYCPSYLACPSTQSAIRDIVPVERLTATTPEAERRLAFRMTMDIESTEHAAWLLPRVNLLRDAAESIREALKKWSDEHGDIPTGPGSVWGPVPCGRSSFSADKAKALMRLLGASEEQIDACYSRTTSMSHREHNVKPARKRSAA